MIHHHPYDEYESSRASHYGREAAGPHRGLPSPPSFYATAPLTTPIGSGNSHYYHHHPHHHPPPALHSQQEPFYYAPAPHPYVAHYPPPPPPPPSGAQYETDYSEHPPFSPFDYQQRQLPYSHTPLPPSKYAPSGYSKGHAPPQQSMAREGYDGGRAAKFSDVGPRSPIGESQSVLLSDQQPTYIGHIKSANDAILLLSACDLPGNSAHSPSSKARDNTLPPPRRVTRRLLDSERAELVSSGRVFVWDEKEAGMKRWTDGRVWSASRVSGCFLTYRELEARKKVNNAMAEGPTSNQYKPEGLIKQSFSITTSSGRKLHVISYFTKRDIREGRLRRVSEDPRFVGEGGGEWGLQVDEKEYSFPEVTQQLIRSQGQTEGGVSSDATRPHGQIARERGGEEERSESSDLSDPSSPLPQSSEGVKEDRGLAAPQTESQKRPMADEGVSGRASARPRLTRLRSSSMSGIASRELKQSSYQSNASSLDTSVPSEPESGLSKEKFSRGGLTVGTNQNRSSAIRALVSPTLPRESAIRDSACEMKPTQSQDCANAVGALLSLAGKTSSGEEDKGGAGAPNGSPLAINSTPSSPTSSNAVGLGLNVKAAPKRRDSDRAALNKFSIRL